jgi:two-component system CheB/CheR fusion protein
VAGGSVEVAWALEKRSETQLVIDWKERGGPPVGPSSPRGFGLTLIEREVGHGLGGKVRVEFERKGVQVNLRIPLGGE